MWGHRAQTGSLQRRTKATTSGREVIPNEVFLGVEDFSLGSRLSWATPTEENQGSRVLCDEETTRPMSLILIGDVCDANFNIAPDVGYGPDLSLVDIVSGFSLQRPRHLHFRQFWDRTLLNVTYITESYQYKTKDYTNTLPESDGTVAVFHRFAAEVGKFGGKKNKEDPTLKRVYSYQLGSHLRPDDFTHYAPDMWGLASPEAHDELLHLDASPDYALRLLPAYVLCTPRRILQPRHYPFLRGSLVEVIVVFKDLKINGGDYRACVPVIKEVSMLLPHGYNETTSVLYTGSGLVFN